MQQQQKAKGSIRGRIYVIKHLNTQLVCWEEGYSVFKEIFQVYQIQFVKKKNSLLSAIGSKVFRTNSSAWCSDREGCSWESLKLRSESQSENMDLKPRQTTIRIPRVSFLPLKVKEFSYRGATQLGV